MKIGASARNVAIAGFYCTVLVRAVVHHIKSTTMYEGTFVVVYMYSTCTRTVMKVLPYKVTNKFVLSYFRKYESTFVPSKVVR